MAALLADGPVAANTIKEGARAMDIGSSTIDRVKQQLGIKATKSKGGRWVWSLPTYPSVDGDDDLEGPPENNNNIISSMSDRRDGNLP